MRGRAVAQLQVRPGPGRPRTVRAGAHPDRRGRLARPVRSGARPRSPPSSGTSMSSVVLATRTTDDAGPGCCSRRPSPGTSTVPCGVCTVPPGERHRLVADRGDLVDVPGAQAARRRACWTDPSVTSRRVTAPSLAATPSTAPLLRHDDLAALAELDVRRVRPDPQPVQVADPSHPGVAVRVDDGHRPASHRRRFAPGVATCVVAVTDAGSTTEIWPGLDEQDVALVLQDVERRPLGHQAAVELLDLGVVPAELALARGGQPDRTVVQVEAREREALVDEREHGDRGRGR